MKTRPTSGLLGRDDRTVDALVNARRVTGFDGPHILVVDPTVHLSKNAEGVGHAADGSPAGRVQPRLRVPDAWASELEAVV